jgi:hypothetical protein
MSTAQRIEELILATKDLKSPEEFLARYPFPFLVLEATRGGGGGAGDAPGAPRGGTTRVSKAAAPMGDGFVDGDVWVHRICPKDFERNEGAVTLGRDEGCDVVVAEGSISQQHARFTLEVEAPDPDEDDDDGKRFYVTDDGSSNGTFVDGVQITAGKPALITNMASVRFGPQVKFQFFTSRGFFDFLAFFKRIKRPGKPS